MKLPKPHSIKIKLDGVEYESIADAARKLGFSEPSLAKAIRDGKRYFRWIEKVEHIKLIEVVNDKD